MKRRHHGFTLIELAIVITVIGLLLGGVFLAGSSVLERSRFASLLAKIKDMGAAANVFKTKYGYLPGDLPNAGTYITADGGISAGCNYAPAATPAPGDGLVNTTTESTCALEHLVRSGLLAKAELDATTTPPSYFINSDFGVGGRVSLWFNSLTNENVIRITNLPCSTALEIDRKLDADSATPLSSGNVRGLDASNAAIGTCTPGGTNDPVLSLLVKY